MTVITKFCREHLGYRISNNEHQMAVIQTRSTGRECSSTLIYGRCSLGNLPKDWIKFT